VHSDCFTKGQRAKGRPLPTSHETCWGVFNMKIFSALFLLVGLLAENTAVIATALFILCVGVMYEK
jgi:hypothetical protein